MNDDVPPSHDENAHYVFTVRFRLLPTTPDVSVEPRTFETSLYRKADHPGEPGWLFFRDNLWRGKVGDHEHFRTLTEEALDVPVDSVSFGELRTTPAYLDALKEAIADDLATFNADSVEEVLTKYLGSSIHVVETLG